MIMRRMLWLRIFVILSSIAGICYAIFILTDPVSVFWETTLIAVNMLQFAISAWQNSRARFSPDERKFMDQHFSGLPTGQLPPAGTAAPTTSAPEGSYRQTPKPLLVSGAPKSASAVLPFHCTASPSRMPPASLSATTVEGTNTPFSTVFTVLRLTPMRSANSA